LPPKFDLVNERIKIDTTSSQLQQQQQRQQSPQSNAMNTEKAELQQQGLIFTASDGHVERHSNDKQLYISMRARPLPTQVARFLEENAQLIKLLNKLNHNKISSSEVDAINMINEFKSKLSQELELADKENQTVPCVFNESGGDAWMSILNRIISFGPNKSGPNVLVDLSSNSDEQLIKTSTSVWSMLNNVTNSSGSVKAITPKSSSNDLLNNSNYNKLTFKDLENNIILGFQLATSKGPLCEEPMYGVAFFIEKFAINGLFESKESSKSLIDILDEFNIEESKHEKIIDSKKVVQKDNENKEYDDVDDNEENGQLKLFELQQATNESMISQQEEMSPNTNEELKNERKNESLERRLKCQSLAMQCVRITREACKKAFEAQPQRLMVAMYKVEIMIVNSEALGKLYAVLGKRNAKILDESLKEGTSMFIVSAHIPVSDSFGLAEEIRKKTSGLASPHIEFSHFETIEMDPYWEPKTEEELLLFGDKADFENQAKKYMNEIRKRKGLFVREKLIEYAEKQRNLTIK
jgi:ribosome assembly protein 1